jgi:hypothetical protein
MNPAFASVYMMQCTTRRGVKSQPVGTTSQGSPFMIANNIGSAGALFPNGIGNGTTGEMLHPPTNRH